jgi:hypothetical protein
MLLRAKLCLLLLLAVSACADQPASRAASEGGAPIATTDTSYSGPGVPDGTPIDAALVNELLAWVVVQSGYNPPAPPVVIASREKFVQLMRRTGGRMGGARAMYIPGMVVLDNHHWDAQDPMQLSLLVHDLVHHAQLFSGNAYPCRAAKEFEAYTLQNKWLAEHGAGFFASDAWIERMSQCPENAPLQEAALEQPEINTAAAPGGEAE